MRATLDIDDDVLDAAKRLAATERKSTGRVLSDLARKGLSGRALPKPAEMPPVRERNGWFVLTGRSGQVDPELIEDLLAKDDLARSGGASESE